MGHHTTGITGIESITTATIVIITTTVKGIIDGIGAGSRAARQQRAVEKFEEKNRRTPSPET